MSIDKQIGKNIRTRRKELKMNMETLAAEMSMTRQRISDIERGDRSITANELKLAADALDTTVGALWEDIQGNDEEYIRGKEAAKQIANYFNLII